MIVLNNQRWDVFLVPPYDENLYRSDGSLTIGMCDSTNRVIYVSNNLDEDLFYKVLAHEITHAAMTAYKVNLTYDQEELLANIIATYGEEIVYITNKVFKKMKGRLI